MSGQDWTQLSPECTACAAAAWTWTMSDCQIHIRSGAIFARLLDYNYCTTHVYSAHQLRTATGHDGAAAG